MSTDAVHITHSPEETEDLGARLAADLRPGDVLALYGDLGAGKTCLVRGLARGLGATQPAVSPTFTLINEYPGRLPLYHFDLFRVNTPAELEDLGSDEYFFGEGVTVVEWAERAGALLPSRCYDIRLEVTGENERRITVRPPAAGRTHADPGR
jgi:tRNA threonylcarbamoyladenosine biosynthesis protein TsaE